MERNLKNLINAKVLIVIKLFTVNPFQDNLQLSSYSMKGKLLI